MFKSIIIASVFAFSHAIELTPANWEEKTLGKTTFVKFFAPWCGHCKAMKPAWDSLMKEFDTSETILVADVNCIEEGADLCKKHGVKGFPTVKYGDPSNLEDYKGARDLDSLKTFANDLKPGCNAVSLEYCDDEQKEIIKTLFEESDTDLAKRVEDYDTEMKTLANEMEKFIGEFRATYQTLVLQKENAEKELAIDTNIKLVKSVISANKNDKSTEL